LTTATASRTEIKGFIEAKASPAGEIEAIFSVFGNIDRDGDVVTREALAPYHGQSIGIVDSHDWSLKSWIGRGVIDVTAADARVKGRLFMDSESGRDAYAKLREMGSLAQWSWAFRIAENGATYEKRDGRTVRRITRLAEGPYEASVVLQGSNPETGTVSLKARGFGELDSWLSDVRGESEDDSFSAKSLARRGYDVQDEWLQYKGVAIYPASVVEKPADDDRHELVALRKEARTVTSPEYGSAFWAHLRAAPHQSPLISTQIKALSEGTDGSGGYLVPGELLAAITAQRAASAVVRPFATVVPTIRDVLQIPMSAPASSDPDNWASDLLAQWVGEVPSFTSADPSFQLINIPVRKLWLPLRVSSDLFMDAPALEAHIAATGGENLAAREDQGFIAGAGFGVEPLGIINDGSLASASVGAPTVAGVQGLVEALPAQYRGRARWLLNNALEADIRALVHTNGDFAYPRDGAGTIEGRPVSLTPFTGNSTAVFGALASFYIADRLSMSLRVLRERYADTDEIGILLKSRVGGAVVRANGLKLGTTP
jgi:HK97 family phage major capsid protein